MHILVVDSDPIQIQSLTRGLKGRGHSVVTATSISEALTILDAGADDIHLILTDLKIPQLDAFALTGRVRVKKELLPVIIMTTFISSGLRKIIQHDPCISMIEKPFGLERLLQEIKRFEPAYKSDNCSL